MYRRMGPKDLEKVIEEVKMKKEKQPDIVDILKAGGFGVVEGKDAVLAKIDEIGRKQPTTNSTMPLGFN